MRSIVRFLFVAALVCSAVDAYGQSDPLESLSDAEAARVLELLQVARSAEEAGRWLDAWAAYDDVHELVELPEVRLREGRALEELARYGDAAALYERLSAMGGSVAAAANDRLAALASAHPAILEITISGSPANLTVNDDDLGLVEGTVTARLSPGTHTVEVAADGYDPVRYSVDLDFGQSDSRVFTFAARPEVAPSPPDERGSSAVWPVVLGSSAAVAVGLGAGLIARRDNAASEARTGREDGTISSTRYHELEGRYDRSHRGAISAFVIGGGLAAGAVVAALVGDGDDADTASVRLAPTASRTGGGAIVRVDW